MRGNPREKKQMNGLFMALRFSAAEGNEGKPDVEKLFPKCEASRVSRQIPRCFADTTHGTQVSGSCCVRRELMEPVLIPSRMDLLAFAEIVL